MRLRFPGRGSGDLPRYEASARHRRARARAHLDRVRTRAGAPASRRGWPAPVLAAAGFAAGMAVSGPLLSGLGGERGPRLYVTGHGTLAPTDLRDALGLPEAAALRALSEDAVAARLASHPWVASARAVRLPGGAVVAGVRGREPVAVTRAGDPAEAWVVDATGTPFAPVGARDLAHLPRVEGPDPARPGEPQPELARALRLLGAAPERGLPAPLRVEVDAGPRGLVALFPELSASVVLGHEAPEEALSRLAELLAADLPALRQAAEIDLRFADQAVLREAAPGRGGASGGSKRMRGAVRTGPTGRSGGPQGGENHTWHGRTS